MGKSYSVQKKEEEVIIAQNGANQASTSNLEIKMETLMTLVTVMGVLMCVAAAVLAYKKCTDRTGKVLRKQLDTFRAASVVAVPQGQVNPTFNV